MLRSRTHNILLFLWLFAIFAPSTISLLSEENKSIVTVNLNEEEQQEQGKNDVDEKLIAEESYSDFSLLSRFQSSLLYDFHMFGNSEHTSEIILPPPERLI